MKKTILTAALLGLSGCGGYSPIHYPPLPVTDTLTKVEDNKNFKVTDKASFADADLLYPTRTGKEYHIIPVGDYLLSRIVLALPEDAKITNIHLNHFESVCAGQGTFAPHLWCKTNSIISVSVGGSKYALNVSDEADVGPVFIPGDISLPFTWGDSLNSALSAQAEQAVDHFAIKVQEVFSKRHLTSACSVLDIPG